MKNIRFVLLLSVSIALPVTGNDALLPAFAAEQAREFDKAIQTLRSLDRSDSETRFHLARIQYLSGSSEAALETLDQLIAGDPTYANAWYLKGLVHLARLSEVGLFRMVGEANRAVDAWQKTVELDPGHVDARYGVIAYYANAPGIAGGSLKKARSLQQELAEINAAYGIMADGLILSREENFSAAEAQFLEAARLMDRAGPHFGLAQFYLGQEDYEKALSEIEKFDQKEKRWWDADITFSHLLKAQAYAGLGDTEKARYYIDLAMSLKPNKRVKRMLEDTLQAL